MKKTTLIACLFATFSTFIFAQTPAQMDCVELKKRIDNAFKNKTSIRIEYWSSERNIYADYEQDAQSNQHLVVKNTGKKFLRQILIEVKDKKYFSTDKGYSRDPNVWEEKTPTNFNYNAWIDSCKSASSVFNLPFKNCFLSEEIMITGMAYSIHSIKIANDTFDVWINKSTDKLERITGKNKAKITRFEWLFDIPFSVAAPPEKQEENNNFGTNMFPPSYSFDEFDGTERVYVTVDKMAEYAEGQKEMFKFMGMNIRYPKEARENGIQGTIYIGFVVEKDGKLTNINIKRGISRDCNEEALRVLKLMSGKWSAGIYNGQKVRQAFTLPTKFKLE
jgi:TonB family protein